MQSQRWHFVVGPLVTVVTGVTVMLVDRYVVHISYPGALLVLCVAVSAYVGGMISGLLSAVITIGFGFVFLDPTQLFGYQPEATFRFASLVVVSLAGAVFVGVVRWREVRALQEERRHRERVEAANRELLTLRSALDKIENGVVLLGADMRARFMNRKFRDTWNIPDDKADGNPLFADIMQHVQETNGYAARGEELKALVAQRLAMVEAGNPEPFDLRTATGRVIRAQYAALPEGGRLLTYTEVTDLVRQAEQLETLAITDGLSGLYNRRHFLELADSEWSRYVRHGRPFALVVLDIDSFKTINDDFGHDVGDRMIVHVAALCREDRRPSDVVARMGGEEFAILLPETDRAAAASIGERLRRRIAADPLVHDGRPLAVSVSIGVATARAGVADLAALMKEADRALYEAKRQGRDRVVVAGGARLVVAPEATLQPAEARASKRVSG
jgi:diguanylate cyclase (GGDEF)-like protein